MAQWYYSKGGEQKGPVEQQELQRLLSTGEVKSSDLVWRDGLANWQAASQVPELAAVAAQPQPGFSSPPCPAGRLSAAAARLPTPVIATALRPAGAAAAGIWRVRRRRARAMPAGRASRGCADGDDPLDHRPGLLRYLRHHRLVLGMKAKKNMQASGNFEGQGMATAAIVMGWISIAFMVIAIIGQIALRASH